MATRAFKIDGSTNGSGWTGGTGYFFFTKIDCPFVPALTGLVVSAGVSGGILNFTSGFWAGGFSTFYGWGLTVLLASLDSTKQSARIL